MEDRWGGGEYVIFEPYSGGLIKPLRFVQQIPLAQFKFKNQGHLLDLRVSFGDLVREHSLELEITLCAVLLIKGWKLIWAG
jgi:hypothetical protein